MSFYVKKNGQPVEVAGRPGPPGPKGEDGADGAPGPPGPPGESGSVPQHYRHSQGVPATTWLIEHHLGYFPGGIIVKDSGGTEHFEFGVDHVDENIVILTFVYAFGGTADLS